ncbi:hydroxymethylglutaryl-CoA synthase [Candidatus Gottesmanbacteria bacterium]|nr:hydroxymethylglutaryl-CoA synthase [Candidatus Gottesmanbacteria bacterium]
MIGIVSYGTYIPQYRIKISDIAAAWRKEPSEVIGALSVAEKSVPAIDEDAVTIALECARSALVTSALSPESIEGLFVGSESHPYAVNPTSTIVGELLGIGNNYLAADLEFACKAGTAGMQAIAGLIESGHIKYGLAIGADTAQSKPHDVLEYTSAAAGAAFLLGREKGEPRRFSHGRVKIDMIDESQVIAKLLSYTSYSSDTPDFWRRDGIRYPSHAGRFTGEPAYFAHVMDAGLRLLAQTQTKPSTIDYCVFHMPNGKFPRDVARRLGFTPAQLAQSLTVDSIGNPYSASSMLGLAAVLDIAKQGQKIFMVSYGSGAGSDAFLWETTAALRQTQNSKLKTQNLVNQQIQKKTYVDYLGYLKQTHKI